MSKTIKSNMQSTAKKIAFAKKLQKLEN